MLKELNIGNIKQIVLVRHFNSFFDVILEAIGGKTHIKYNTVSKLLEIKSFYDLCGICRTRNPTIKSYTFRQK